MKILSGIIGISVFVVLGLVGCGGGGGTDSVSSSYKGSTAQATITSSNARVVSVDAVQGAQDAAIVGVIGKSTAEMQGASPQLLSILNLLENSISHISTNNISPNAAVGKTIDASMQSTEMGYSGSYSYTMNGNDATGVFSGTITFNFYKEYSYSTAISGNVAFNGVIDTSTGTITSLNMKVFNLLGESGYQSGTLNGNISIINNGAFKTLNISVVRLNNETKNTYWTKDFSFVIGINTMTISGTYYDHINGYVFVSTVTPLTVSEYFGIPTSGQLLFTGRNGTKARLTYTYSGYILEVDSSGDNIFVVIP